jgi:iron transport multicopper oxidase
VCDGFDSSFNSTLINGKGTYPGGPSNVSLAVVNVHAGKRLVSYLLFDRACFDVSGPISYRFRLVSISCDPSFTFSIDGHQMTIIEVEGTNVQPLQVDSINIFVGTHISYYLVSSIVLTDAETGQRYSVVVRRSFHLRIRSVCLIHP